MAEQESQEQESQEQESQEQESQEQESQEQDPLTTAFDVIKQQSLQIDRLTQQINRLIRSGASIKDDNVSNNDVNIYDNVGDGLPPDEGKHKDLPTLKDLGKAIGAKPDKEQ